MGLEGVELAIAIEESFGIKLSDAETAESVTVGDIVDLAWSKVNSREDWSETGVREVVHEHIREYLGVKACQDSDRLVEDLGME